MNRQECRPFPDHRLCWDEKRTLPCRVRGWSLAWPFHPIPSRRCVICFEFDYFRQMAVRRQTPIADRCIVLQNPTLRKIGEAAMRGECFAAPGNAVLAEYAHPPRPWPSGNLNGSAHDLVPTPDSQFDTKSVTGYTLLRIYSAFSDSWSSPRHLLKEKRTG